MKLQGAKIDVWGVGTKLVTAFDQPALGGVYKLGAIQNEKGDWQYRIKLSEQSIKVSNPGILQVRRFENDTEFVGDMIFNVPAPAMQSPESPSRTVTMIDPANSLRQKSYRGESQSEDLLKTVFRRGEHIAGPPTLESIRQRTQTQLAKTPVWTKRFDNPHLYPVGLERSLYEMKEAMI